MFLKKINNCMFIGVVFIDDLVDTHSAVIYEWSNMVILTT